MLWNLEELVEDAVVGYLSAAVSGEMRVSAAYNLDAPEFPCCLVFAESAEPISEPAAWHDARKIALRVAVMTEAAPEVDTGGTTIRTARTRNASARSDVMNALTASDVVAQLNAQGINGVAFSGAQVTSTARSVEDRAMVTTINVEVYAEPVTGS